MTKKIDVEGVIQKITGYQAWIADGKLGDERNRVNPILNDARVALEQQAKEIRSLTRQLEKTTEKLASKKQVARAKKKTGTITKSNKQKRKSQS